VDLHKILVKYVVELYTTIVSSILNEKADSAQTVPKESVRSTEEAPSEEPLQKGFLSMTLPSKKFL
jgi:hypothetical protein